MATSSTTTTTTDRCTPCTESTTPKANPNYIPTPCDDGCLEEFESQCVTYSGTDIYCFNINQGSDLNDVIIKLAEYACGGPITTTTTTTTSSTTTTTTAPPPTTSTTTTTTKYIPDNLVVQTVYAGSEFISINLLVQGSNVGDSSIETYTNVTNLQPSGLNFISLTPQSKNISTIKLDNNSLFNLSVAVQYSQNNGGSFVNSYTFTIPAGSSTGAYYGLPIPIDYGANGNNILRFVISVIVPTTTTSTTTTTTSTTTSTSTTTTTTLPPTTTTTTTSTTTTTTAPVCTYYSAENTTSSAIILTYKNCSNNVIYLSVPAGQTRYVCSLGIISFGSLVITSYGSCATTTTTTSTTTSTTTTTTTVNPNKFYSGTVQIVNNTSATATSAGAWGTSQPPVATMSTGTWSFNSTSTSGITLTILSGGLAPYNIDISGLTISGGTLTSLISPNIDLISSGGNVSISGVIVINDAPIEICCPPGGYTLNDDKSECYKIDEVAATPPTGGTSQVAVARTNVSYSTCGTYVYLPGYNINGTGTSSKIPSTNSFWTNGAGNCVDNVANQGPLNRAGLWTSTATNGQTIGFSVCINLTYSKQYYIGIACDNYGQIKVDGTTIINQDTAAIEAQYGSVVGATFKVWHIYPVTLSAGPHIVEFIGVNVSGPAAFGAEMYDNTASQILQAFDYTGLNVVFSTKDYIGQPIQLGSGGTGYSCPAGYSLASCATPFVCRQRVTASPVPCGTSSTTTTTTTPPTAEIVYYGTKSTGSTPTSTEILTASSIYANGASNVSLNWGTTSSVPVFYFFAIKKVTGQEPSRIKLKWAQQSNPINKGNIGTSTDLFKTYATVNISGVDYYVWITNYLTQFDFDNYIFSVT